jgi:hypothetical protein
VGCRTVIKAFIERKARKIKNDWTDGDMLMFHYHLIAYWTPERDLRWTMAGYGTYTTRVRLDVLFSELNLPFRVFQKKHQQYLWHMGRDEEREISSGLTYTVDRFEIEVMRRAA